MKEKNVHIAIFMGAIMHQWYPFNIHSNSTGQYYQFKKGEFPANEEYVGDYALKYDKSWNWLMPVWRKFNTLPLFGVADRIKMLSFKEKINKSFATGSISETFELIYTALYWYANK